MRGRGFSAVITAKITRTAKNPDLGSTHLKIDKKKPVLNRFVIS
jgi:hypothetical protein